MTTPAEMNQPIIVGLIISSVVTAFVARIFLTCLSLLDSLDLRFGGTDRCERGCGAVLFSSDSGTSLRVVGCVERLAGATGGDCSLRTAAAQESSVVNEARKAAS